MLIFTMACYVGTHEIQDSQFLLAAEGLHFFLISPASWRGPQVVKVDFLPKGFV